MAVPLGDGALGRSNCNDQGLFAVQELGQRPARTIHVFEVEIVNQFTRVEPKGADDVCGHQLGCSTRHGEEDEATGHHGQCGGDYQRATDHEISLRVTSSHAAVGEGR